MFSLRIWVKDWVLHRQQEGFYAKLYSQIRANEPDLYRNFLRMDIEQFDHLLLLVTPHIKKADTNMRQSISAGETLVMTLRYLATGENFRSLQFLFRIPVSTISRIIPEVLDAIYKVLVGKYLQTPCDTDAWMSVSSKFNELWHFPNCIGAVDGKHVVMDAPPNAGSIFYNYKGTHSIVLMGIADAEYKFLYIDVGRNGRFSDVGVFNSCTFRKALDSNKLCLPPPKALPGRQMPVPYVLVADDAFAMRPNLMKPYAQRGLTMVQQVYNYRLSRGRRIIENVFGIMSARFRMFRKPICLDAEKTKKVTLACCVLHNYLMVTNKKKYAPPNAFDHYDSTGTMDKSMFPLQRTRTDALNAKDVQN
ncbi:Protein ALP1-like [Lucilia cuprina]|nr:Protein ALP1-like [Lucilia cuprina]